MAIWMFSAMKISGPCLGKEAFMSFDECKIGDRVVFVDDFAPDGGSVETGATGTICDIIEASDPHIGVNRDEQIKGGHSCHGTCVDGHGWYVHEYQLEAESSQCEIEPAADDEICSMLGL